MSLPRFFAPSVEAGDDRATLPRDETAHLTRVLRLGPGDTVAVFNGRGLEYLARVMAPVSREVQLQLVSRIEPAAEAQVQLTIAVAVLKTKMDDVVRDAVMLGVAVVQPILSEHSETTMAALERGRRLERWRRIALASVKQSRRAVVPEVRPPLSLASFISGPLSTLTLMCVEPSAGATVVPLSALAAEGPPRDATVLIGPEGGWADAEWQTARAHGIKLVTLGPRTLRADAAPIAVVSVLQFLWGEF